MKDASEYILFVLILILFAIPSSQSSEQSLNQCVARAYAARFNDSELQGFMSVCMKGEGYRVNAYDEQCYPGDAQASIQERCYEKPSWWKDAWHWSLQQLKVKQ